MSTFQLVVMIILGFSAFAGVGFFALYRGSSANIVHVSMWGTLPATQVNKLLQEQAITDVLEEQLVSVSYVQKADSTIDDELLRAMAIGQGPDAIILSQDQILQYQDRIVPIPYTSLPLRTFRDTYIQEADLYLQPAGITALPFQIDPLVMYYNRDLLTSANIAQVPQYWSDVQNTLVPRISQATTQGAISQSAIALGGFANIMHAKEIISLLLLQAGSPIVGQDGVSGKYQVALSSLGSSGQNPGDRALSFYTQFADPTKSSYSWNASLPVDRDAFLSGKLALYFGFASEFNDLRERNPNLNFDVAPVPQTDSTQTKISFGKMYGIALLKSAPSVQSTFTAISVLASPQVQALWSSITQLPPISRALLAQTPADPNDVIFYAAALQSRGWLDPNPVATNNIFGTMVRNILSGVSRPIEAVRVAESQLQEYLPVN